MDLKKATFWGYKRENGRIGVRNHVIILPVDDLSNAAAEAVSSRLRLETRTSCSAFTSTSPTQDASTICDMSLFAGKKRLTEMVSCAG